MYDEMRDAPPLPVTTTVFFFFCLLVFFFLGPPTPSAPHFTRHLGQRRSPRTPYHTARHETRSLARSLAHRTLTAVPRPPWRYGAHASCTRCVQSQVNVHACTRSTRPRERPFVRPPSRSFVRSFVPPSVRPSVRRSIRLSVRLSSCRRASSPLRSAFHRSRTPATIHRTRARTHAAGHRHMFQRASSVVGTRARTYACTHVFHEKECCPSSEFHASSDTATEFSRPLPPSSLPLSAPLPNVCAAGGGRSWACATAPTLADALSLRERSPDRGI